MKFVSTHIEKRTSQIAVYIRSIDTPSRRYFAGITYRLNPSAPALVDPIVDLQVIKNSSSGEKWTTVFFGEPSGGFPRYRTPCPTKHGDALAFVASLCIPLKKMFWPKVKTLPRGRRY